MTATCPTPKSRHGFASSSTASRWSYDYCVDAIGDFGDIDMAIEPTGSPGFTAEFATAAAGTAGRALLCKIALPFLDLVELENAIKSVVPGAENPCVGGSIPPQATTYKLRRI